MHGIICSSSCCIMLLCFILLGTIQVHVHVYMYVVVAIHRVKWNACTCIHVYLHVHLVLFSPSLPSLPSLPLPFPPSLPLPSPSCLPSLQSMPLSLHSTDDLPIWGKFRTLIHVHAYMYCTCVHVHVYIHIHNIYKIFWTQRKQDDYYSSSCDVHVNVLPVVVCQASGHEMFMWMYYLSWCVRHQVMWCSCDCTTCCGMSGISSCDVHVNVLPVVVCQASAHVMFMWMYYLSWCVRHQLMWCSCDLLWCVRHQVMWCSCECTTCCGMSGISSCDVHVNVLPVVVCQASAHVMFMWMYYLLWCVRHQLMWCSCECTTCCGVSGISSCDVHVNVLPVVVCQASAHVMFMWMYYLLWCVRHQLMWCSCECTTCCGMSGISSCDVHVNVLPVVVCQASAHVMFMWMYYLSWCVRHQLMWCPCECTTCCGMSGISSCDVHVNVLPVVVCQASAHVMFMWMYYLSWCVRHQLMWCSCDLLWCVRHQVMWCSCECTTCCGVSGISSCDVHVNVLPVVVCQASGHVMFMWLYYLLWCVRHQLMWCSCECTTCCGVSGISSCDVHVTCCGVSGISSCDVHVNVLPVVVCQASAHVMFMWMYYLLWYVRHQLMWCSCECTTCCGVSGISSCDVHVNVLPVVVCQASAHVMFMWMYYLSWCVRHQLMWCSCECTTCRGVSGIRSCDVHVNVLPVVVCQASAHVMFMWMYYLSWCVRHQLMWCSCECTTCRGVSGISSCDVHVNVLPVVVCQASAHVMFMWMYYLSWCVRHQVMWCSCDCTTCRGVSGISSCDVHVTVLPVVVCQASAHVMFMWMYYLSWCVRHQVMWCSCECTTCRGVSGISSCDVHVNVLPVVVCQASAHVMFMWMYYLSWCVRHQVMWCSCECTTCRGVSGISSCDVHVNVLPVVVCQASGHVMFMWMYYLLWCVRHQLMWCSCECTTCCGVSGIRSCDVHVNVLPVVVCQASGHVMFMWMYYLLWCVRHQLMWCSCECTTCCGVSGISSCDVHVNVLPVVVCQASGHVMFMWMYYLSWCVRHQLMWCSCECTTCRGVSGISSCDVHVNVLPVVVCQASAHVMFMWMYYLSWCVRHHRRSGVRGGWE